MFILDENTNAIRITKGDTGYVSLKASYEDGTEYTFSDSDEVLIQVRKGRGEDYDLAFEGTVEIEDGAATWHILPEDTEEMTTGRSYYYDVQLNTESGDVYTFIGASKFKVLPQITKED